MTLNSQGEYHVLTAHPLTGFQGDLEVSPCAANSRHFGAIADVDVRVVDCLLPRLEDALAATGRESHITAQRKHARLRHDVLVLLILLDRIRVRAARFQQDVRHLLPGSMSGRAQSSGSGSDHDHIKLQIPHSAAFPSIPRSPAKVL
jgi:hypothetical protein